MAEMLKGRLIKFGVQPVQANLRQIYRGCVLKLDI